jgi:hypothetical protein
MEYFNKFLEKEFTLELALKYSNYLTYNNIKTLNLWLNIANQLNQTKYNQELQECGVCMDEKYVAIYNCNCSKKHICPSCFLEVCACPMCRKNLK